MPDLSIIASAISTAGALLGALGGVALTHRTSARREEAQANREEVQFNRQQEEQCRQARQQASTDLLGTANQLKAEVQIAGIRRLWPDMDVRLATIQQRAVSAAMHASRVALLSSDTAEAAFALASAAARLAAATAAKTEMLNQDGRFLGGRITDSIDFAEFDECLARFAQAAQGSEE